VRILPLAASLFLCGGPVAALGSSSQRVSSAPIRKAQAGDLLAQVLSRCPKKNRLVFFNNLSFIGSQVAGVYHGPIDDYLGDVPLKRLIDALTAVGDPVKKGEARPPLQILFSRCSHAVRAKFYAGLRFRGGRLVALSSETVAGCARSQDMAHFLSLFGVDGARLAAKMKMSAGKRTEAR
jgi:hypothetical protein